MINGQFEDLISMRCKIRAMKKIIEEFKSGERYLKIQKDYHKVIDGYRKEIKNLRSEVGRLNARIISNRNMLLDASEDAYEEKQAEIRKLEEKIRRLQDENWGLMQEIDELSMRLTLKYENEIYEKECEIEKLKNENAHLKALLSHDGSNTSIPTSQTPIGKKKRNPINSREKSGKSKGGQKGHAKHMLEPPEDAEITDAIEHDYRTDDFFCPSCNGEKYIPTGEYEVKYEYDFEIVVKKKKHIFYWYRCLDCGTEFRSKYPSALRGFVQYGSGLQAMALSLTNTVNSAMNKTAMFLNGITGGELSPCEGYIAKLQKRAAQNLVQFREDLKKRLITKKIVYWDDTVITILTKRACFRFYGDETIAYYTAHGKKNMKGIDEDGVLELLTSETTVMHDHNTINYNKKFHFKNIECVQHLERDLQKNSDETQHKWSSKAKKLIGKTTKERNEAIRNGEECFDGEYIDSFNKKMDEIISEGWEEHEEYGDKYNASDENALLIRIQKYRKNYFMWIEDFSLPSTNNLSERGLRGVKSHMKISGQFESVEAARDHATIKTYTETCRRNGINEIKALQRLCEGKPFTVQEIFSKSPPGK